ncbi:MAG: lysoplasmalogenase [Flavobacterium sp.]|nr:lysoplasmalogenase [Flavobacterium sp.]
MKNKIALYVYLGFSLIYLTITALNLEEIARLLKPFLLPILLIAVYLSNTFSSKKILLTALTFSWIGDIVLLFANKGELYFIIGLVAFLISHVFYIVLFNQQAVTTSISNKISFGAGIGLILLYFFGMITTLGPKLGPLTVPVIVYAIVISSMLYFALKGSYQWNAIPYQSVLVGALFFIASDSILAFNKFYQPIPYASFLIMITYLGAQYGIVWGILNLNQKK